MSSDRNVPSRRDTDSAVSSEVQSEALKLYNEIRKRKGKLTDEDIVDLKIKYKYPVIEAVLDMTRRRRKKMAKIAKKLASKLISKYPDMSPAIIFKNAQKENAKQKLDLTDAEFDEFKRLINREIGYDANYDLEVKTSSLDTKISRTLGEVRQYNDEMKVGDDEKQYLQDILKIANDPVHKSLYHHLFFQTFSYKDCAIEALSGEFRRAKDHPHQHIHPLFIALYLVKIKAIETQTLYADMSRIVQYRKERKTIRNYPDYQLYSSLILDGGDPACDDSSPLADLKNRCQVQQLTWETVINLRNGKFYSSNSSNDLIVKLDSCQNRNNENVDVLYLKDEGALASKFLSVYSFKPTVVQTTPIYGLANVRPGGDSFQNYNVPLSLSSVAMFQVRLPFNIIPGQEQKEVNLTDSFNNIQWYLDAENGHRWVSRSIEVLQTRDVLFFHVVRKAYPVRQMPQLSDRIVPGGVFFSKLPPLSASMEHVNCTPVTFPMELTVGNDVLYLRSVVCVETMNVNRGEHSQSIKTGTSALIVQARDLSTNNYENKYLIYDPIGASIIQEGDNNDFYQNKPISKIDLYNPGKDDKYLGFMEKASKTGTVFVYAKLPSDSAEDNFF